MQSGKQNHSSVNSCYELGWVVQRVNTSDEKIQQKRQQRQQKQKDHSFLIKYIFYLANKQKLCVQVIRSICFDFSI